MTENVDPQQPTPPANGVPSQPGDTPPPQYAQPQYAQPRYAPPQYAQPIQQPGASPADVYAGQAYAAAQPPRKGLSTGAWIGIIGGGIALLLAIVLGCLFVFVGLPRILGMPVGDGSRPPIAPQAPVDPAPEFERFSLDDQIEPHATLFWAVPIESEWDIETFDVEGYHRFSDPETGCKILTFQGFGDPAETSNSDRIATENLLESALKIGIPWDTTEDPTVTRDGSQWVFRDGTAEVEFARYISQYNSPTGERERHILVRALMPENTALYAEVDCPKEAAVEVADEVFDGLAVTEY